MTRQDGTVEDLAYRARNAISWIMKSVEDQKSGVRGQTQEESINPATPGLNDDLILGCCRYGHYS